MRPAVLVIAAALAFPGMVITSGCETPPPPLADVPPPRDPARQGVKAPKPGPGYFWVEGYHEYVPEQKLYKWVPGRWERERPGYRFYPAGYRVVQGDKYEFHPERWEEIQTAEGYGF